MIPQDLLEILACPLDKAAVRLVTDAGAEWLVCAQCGRKYPVRDDIPVMLVEEAVLPSGPGAPGPGKAGA
ncbi:MAG TPA: Trm112 family protein [Planctomycetota bacterium]|nr:Trm112 family protein [Planctomycetota bacterium]